MSETKKNPKKQKPAASPRAVVPPRLRPFVGRPVASSAAQRDRRRAARGNERAGYITAAANGSEGELLMYGAIGYDFWTGEGITAKSVDEAIKNLGPVSTIRVRANSGGGDVFEATAIYNILSNHPARIIMQIEGVAASAMTLISMAGDEIHIAENAHYMIHRASGAAFGNSDDLRNYLKLLDNADSLIRLTYSKRTGLTDGELIDLMNHDNWMTATEALDLGFVDVVDEAKTVTPHISPENNSGTSARPIQFDSERLAACAESLNALRIAASAENTGGSPQISIPSQEQEEMSETLNTTTAAVENKTSAPPTIDLAAALEAHEQKMSAKRKAYRAEVDACLKLAFGDEPPADLRLKCYDLQDEGLEAARNAILEAKKAAPAPALGVIRFSDSQPKERHIEAISAGVQVRALAGHAEKYLPTKDRPKDWDRFAHMPLIKIAEQCLLADGFSYDQINRLSNPQIAMAAMGFQRNAGIRNAAALHTTGSLAEVTRDAINKSLTSGYQEAPQTWRGPMRQASSVADFKTIYRVKLSAVGNLPVWNDGLPPEQAKLSNEKESYAVQARAENLSFSWQLLVNDDMDALSRGPQLLSTAAGRTVNAVAWQQITLNPTLADGVALFSAATGNRKRQNLQTGSATPTNTTIGSMRKLMRLMRGLNTPEQSESDDVLNLTPRYLVGPAALEELIMKQVMSSTDPANSNSTAYNSSGSLIPVIEPLLDADSTTAWYLFADPSQIDTVEVTFLQGQETPQAFDYVDNETMAYNYTVVQTFAARAIDHRGIQKHAGA